MDDEQLIAQLDAMTWISRPLEGSDSLLTSDQPSVIAGGLALPNSFIALPIVPRRLFIAANDRAIARHLVDRTPISLRGGSTTPW